MTNLEFPPVCTVVTGAAGRVGRALQTVWGRELAGAPVLWSARQAGQAVDIVWDIGNDAPQTLQRGAIFLHLAGQTRGTPDQLAKNRRSVVHLCDVAKKRDAAHVFLMSSVAVYHPSAALITEDDAPNPAHDYGKAKLAAEDAAREVLPAGKLTILRLGNLAGADTLLSSIRSGPVVLDPIDGQPGGPERSYIGPRLLADVLRSLVQRVMSGQPIPLILNIAQPPALAMADLLAAAGADWRFGPVRAAAIPRVAVSVDRLASLVPVETATARSVIADLNSLRGVWP